jgi:hypothetical protein
VGFPPSFRSNASHYFEEEQAKVHHILGEFAGEYHVSSRTLAGSSMVHFVQSIIDIGISRGRVSPIVTSDSLFPSISAKVASKMIRLSGEAQGEKILSEYQEKRFVNLICDAGTVQSLHTLYALITNPSSETAPLVANMVDSTGFPGDDYAIFFESTLFSQFANAFVICGVVIDNVAIQSLGLRRTLELSKNQAVRAVAEIPGFCHTISLVFSNSIRDLPTLREVIECVSRWEAVLRTRFAPRIMRGTERCPSIPKTRCD